MHLLLALTACLTLVTACIPRTAPSGYATVTLSEAGFTHESSDGVDGFAGTLILHNQSSAAVTVDNVRTDCGCTVAEWSAEPVAPGASVVVPVRISCRKSGSQTQRIEVWLTQLRSPLVADVTVTCP